MKLTWWTLTTALCCSSFYSPAQSGSASKSTTGFYITVPFEVPIINNSAFNSRLRSLNLPESKVPLLAGALGVDLRLKNIVVSFTYTSGERNPKSDTAELRMVYTQGSFTVGYDLLKEPTRSFYPYIGLKACSFKYTYNERLTNIANPTFEQYFAAPLNHKEVRNSKVVADLGIGYSMQRTYYLSLRAGYTLALSKDLWYVNGNLAKLSGGPQLNYQAYVMLSVGIGYLITDGIKAKKRSDLEEM